MEGFLIATKKLSNWRALFLRLLLELLREVDVIGGEERTDKSSNAHADWTDAIDGFANDWIAASAIGGNPSSGGEEGEDASDQEKDGDNRGACHLDEPGWEEREDEREGGSDDQADEASDKKWDFLIAGVGALSEHDLE